MPSIRLHKQFGVNPTIKMCFFCNEPTGEILLLGAAYKEKAPQHLITDYQPCDQCIEKMRQGVTLIEVYDTPPPDAKTKNLTLDGTNVPTGRWWVITPDAASRIFGDAYNGHPKLLISQEAANALGLMHE